MVAHLQAIELEPTNLQKIEALAARQAVERYGVGSAYDNLRHRQERLRALLKNPKRALHAWNALPDPAFGKKVG